MCLDNNSLFNSISKSYGQFRFGNEPVTKMLLSLLRIAQFPKVIIEIGSGTGNYLGSIVNLQNCKAYGVDISANMLSISRDRYPIVYHILTDCEYVLPFMDDKFSMVYSIDFIHYLKNTTDFYNEQFRILINNGLSFTATHSIENLYKQTLGLYFPETIEIESAMTHSIDELNKQIINAGFSDVNIETITVADNLTESDFNLFKGKTVAVLNKISGNQFEKGISKMRDELLCGIGKNVHSYTFITASKKNKISEITWKWVD